MNKKIKSVAAVAALGILCLSGTVFAYLTATDSKTNTFTIGNVRGELTEPNYHPNEERVFPLDVITKDPVITHKGNTDALVFIELTIPVEEVAVVDENGKKLDPADNEVFTLIDEDDVEGNVNDEWVLIKNAVDVKSGDKVCGHKYVYAYKTVLEKDAVTNALFNKVKFINYANGGIESSHVDIVVKADMIQADNLYEGDQVTTDELKTAYGYFDSQDNV